MSLEIRDLSAADARSFMEEFEHLGNVGLGVWHYGCFGPSGLLAVFSFGPTCFSGKRDKIAVLAERCGCRSIQLCRGGTSTLAPPNTSSAALSRALRAIERERGPSLVTAYADPTFGEVGTIYQASNGYFVGWTEPKGQANYVINGKRMSGWTVRKRFGTRALAALRQVDPNVTVQRLSPKMRYALLAASGQRRRQLDAFLSEFSQPYPKRERFDIPSMIDLGCILPRVSPLPEGALAPA